MCSVRPIHEYTVRRIKQQDQAAVTHGNSVCRAFDSNGRGNLLSVVRCMDYCLRNKAHITLNSYGEIMPASPILLQALQSVHVRVPDLSHIVISTTGVIITAAVAIISYPYELAC